MDWSRGRPTRRGPTVHESKSETSVPTCRTRKSFEVSLFRVGEFVHFDEKLPVRTRDWMDGKYL